MAGGMLRAVRGGRALWGGSGKGSGGAKLGRTLRTATPQRSDIFRGEMRALGLRAAGGNASVDVMEMCGGKRGQGGGEGHSVGSQGVQRGFGGVLGGSEGIRMDRGVAEGW